MSLDTDPLCQIPQFSFIPSGEFDLLSHEDPSREHDFPELAYCWQADQDEDTLLQLGPQGPTLVPHLQAIKRLARAGCGLSLITPPDENQDSKFPKARLQALEEMMTSQKVLPSADLLHAASGQTSMMSLLHEPPTAFINLGAFALSGDLDLPSLADTMDQAAHFLRRMRDTRGSGGMIPVRLGVVGFAEMLIRMWIPYSSDASRYMAQAVASTMKKTSGPEGYSGVKVDLHPSEFEATMAHCTPAMDPLESLLSIAPNGSLTLHPDLERLARQQGFFSHQLKEQIIETGAFPDHVRIPKIRSLFRLASEGLEETRQEIQNIFKQKPS